MLTVAGSSKDSFTVDRYDADDKAWKQSGTTGAKLLEGAMEKPVAWQVVKSKFLLDYPAFFVQGSTDFPSKITMTLAKIQKSVDNAVVLFDQGSTFKNSCKISIKAVERKLRTNIPYYNFVFRIQAHGSG